jgi:tetratricopeptide (TPR) repeat protein
MRKTIFLSLFFSVLFTTVYSQGGENNFIVEGIKMYDQGDYEGALAMYKKALVSNPHSVKVKYEIASAYLKMKDAANCIKYSDMVIAANADFVDQAYILKGSAMDIWGKPAEAIKIYKQALLKFPKNQLLHYNLALTSFSLKAYKQTDEALLKALQLNPLHASSHFLQGLSMLTQGKPVQGILALYNFLLLEPKSKRSEAALQALEEEWQKAASQINQEAKTAANGKVQDEFYAVSVLTDILESSPKNQANKSKPAMVLFAENSDSLFRILGQAKKGKTGFWWKFYVDYFYTLSVNHHTEALCYYITQSKDHIYDDWLKDNLPKMEAFSDWYTKYLHKF